MTILPIITVAISLILMILSIVFDWKITIKKLSFGLYWIFCLIGAIICLSFGFAGDSPIKDIFFNDANINPLKILVIFLSCTSISVLLDKIGFFSYIAAVVLKKSKGSQTKLFFAFSAVIAILTIFTSNDILILTFTPFICYFTKRAKINPIPFIISEFVCANVWSMFFFIDNPTNIYMCATFGITFIEYAIKMVLPTILSGFLSCLLVYLIFRKKLHEPISIDDTEIVKPNKAQLIIGVTGLGIMVLMMALSNYIGLELWYIPLVCSVATFICVTIYNLVSHHSMDVIGKSLLSLPYALIPFLLSMSVFITTLSKANFIPQFANFLENQNLFVTGGFSFILGNLLNNIPMTMMFTETLATYNASLPTVYAVIAASNICALLTSFCFNIFINIMPAKEPIGVNKAQMLLAAITA